MTPEDGVVRRTAASPGPLVVQTQGSVDAGMGPAGMPVRHLRGSDGLLRLAIGLLDTSLCLWVVRTADIHYNAVVIEEYPDNGEKLAP